MNNEVVEKHTNIPSSRAADIAAHYRRLGGYKVDLKEYQFRAEITVYRLGDSAIQGNYRRVNR